jgi:histidine kinase
LALSKACRRVFERDEPPAMVCLSGLHGTGKSFLVERGVLPVINTNAYCASGKFDQLRKRQPYSALQAAFTEVCTRMLEEDRDLIDFIIEERMGGNARILTDLVPILNDVIGNHNDEAPKPSSPLEVQNRFNYVFRNFVRTICRHKPLVLIIEDLQWVSIYELTLYLHALSMWELTIHLLVPSLLLLKADKSSLDLMQAILEDKTIKRFLVVGTYRNDEVGPTHIAFEWKNGLSANGIPVTTIELGNLEKDVVTNIISETFSTACEVQPLADVIYQKSAGNPFFLVRLLEHFISEMSLVYDYGSGQWNWDTKEIELKEIPSSLEDLIVEDMQKQSESVIKLLKIGATLGTYFDKYTLSLVVRSGVFGSLTTDDSISTFAGSTSTFFSNSPELMKNTLEEAMAKGFLMENGKLGYRFSHDKVQQVAYSLVEDPNNAHLEIGRLLVKNARPATKSSSRGRGKVSLGTISESDITDFIERQLFVAVDQMNRGKDLISDEGEVASLVRLNVRAADASVESASFSSAKLYLDVGKILINGFDGDIWTGKYYELTLQLITNRAKVELSLGNYDEGKELAQEVLDNAKSLNAKLPVHVALVYSLRREDLFLESFKQSGLVLWRMNEYPKRYIMARAMNHFFAVKKWLKNHSDEAILNLPLMRDEKKVLAMEVMRERSNVAFMLGKITDFLLGILLRLRMSFEHGISEETAAALATHAVSLGMFGDEEGAQRCAKLALQIIDLTKGKRLKGLTLFLVTRFVDSWRLPGSDVMGGFKRAHVSAMEAGDVEMGALCWYNSNWHAFISGMQLAPLVDSLEDNVKQCELYKIGSVGNPANDFLQCVRRITGDVPLDWNELVIEPEGDNAHIQRLVLRYIAWLPVAVYSGNLSVAEKLADKLATWHDSGHSMLNPRLFYSGIMAAGMARETGKSKYISKLKKWEKETKKLSDAKGHNCRHRHLLLKAERVALARGAKFGVVQTAYEDAIKAAAENNNIGDVALGNELVGKYYLRSDNEELARIHLTRAWSAYTEWGAHTKVAAMENEHGERLSSSSVFSGTSGRRLISSAFSDAGLQSGNSFLIRS